MPRIWKKRGRDVPPAQNKLGTWFRTSSKCCWPESRNVWSSSTVTLEATSVSAWGRNVAVTTTSSRESTEVESAAVADAATNAAQVHKTTIRIPDLLNRRPGPKRDESRKNVRERNCMTCSLRRY